MPLSEKTLPLHRVPPGMDSTDKGSMVISVGHSIGWVPLLATRRVEAVFTDRDMGGRNSVGPRTHRTTHEPDRQKKNNIRSITIM